MKPTNPVYKYRFHITLFFSVLGIRLAIFNYSGSPLPYYDQWVYAIDKLFLCKFSALVQQPWFFNTHNEHRLITTLLVEKIGFSLNGYYDITWVFCIAAMLRAITAIIAFHLACGAANAYHKLSWMICFVLFGLPISGYNMLNGMQMSFYLVDIGLLLSIGLMLNWPQQDRNLTKKHLLGHSVLFISCNLLALLSHTNSIAIPVVTLFLHMLRYRPRPGFITSWLISLSGAILLVIFAPVSLQQSPIEAIVRIKSFLIAFAWPANNLFAGLIAISSYIFLIIVIWKERLALNKLQIAACAGLVFGLLNISFIGLGRAETGIHMRHYELMMIAPVCFLYIGFSLVKLYIRFRGLTYGLLGFMSLVFVTNLASKEAEMFTYLKLSHDYRDEALSIYRDKLINGRMLDIGSKTHEQLSKSDTTFFDDPILKYTPGYYCAYNLTVLYNLTALKGSALAILSPDIIPGIPYSAASFCTHLLIECGSLIALLIVTVLTILSFISKQR